MPEQSFTPLTTPALLRSKVVPSRGYMSPAEPPSTRGSSAGANLCLKPNPRRLKGPVWSEHHFNPPLRGIAPSTRSREAARGKWCRARDAEKNRFLWPFAWPESPPGRRREMRFALLQCGGVFAKLPIIPAPCQRRNRGNHNPGWL